MKKVIVYKEPLSQQYSAHRLSFAYLFIILSNICILVVPFYFWTGTNGGLWLKNDKYREQPDVEYLFKFILVLEATSPVTGRGKEIFVSTMDSVNVFRPESYRMANIKFNKDDRNFDGIVDSFKLDATVPLANNEHVVSVHALLFFDFRLQERVKLDMESVAYSSFESGLPISGFDTKGSLMLRQTKPLGIRNYFSTLYAEETPLLDTVNSPANSSIGNILERYRERDITADYVERYHIKSRAVDSPEESDFRFEMKVDIPEQEVLFIPTLLEVLKDAWVKYLSVVILWWILLERIKSFAFKSLFKYSTNSNKPTCF